jgi:uncharacterized protein YcbK (DUF882 family)
VRHGTKVAEAGFKTAIMIAHSPRLATRRRLLRLLALTPLAAAFAPQAWAGEADRSLAFHHLHTHEQLRITYFADGDYIPDALQQVDRLLRDFRTGEISPIDPDLLDTLYRLRVLCGKDGFEVISGYRSPSTNAALSERSSGVARNSLHLEGRAVDVRLSGVDTARVRDAATALRTGGVGYYPESDFVHLDTGRFRVWGPGA